MSDDLALTAARFGAALRAEGVPADPGRCERFARAVTVARPTSGRALYLCALATLISSQAQIQALDRVFGAMFGSMGEPVAQLGGQRAADVPEPSRSSPGDILAQAAHSARMHSTQERPAEQSELPAAEQVVAEGRDEDQDPGPEEETQTARRVIASATERLAGKDFAELSPAELLMLSGLMRKLTLAVPMRRSRRPGPPPTAGVPTCGRRCATPGARAVIRSGWPGGRR